MTSAIPRAKLVLFYLKYTLLYFVIIFDGQEVGISLSMARDVVLLASKIISTTTTITVTYLGKFVRTLWRNTARKVVRNTAMPDEYIIITFSFFSKHTLNILKTGNWFIDIKINTTTKCYVLFQIKSHTLLAEFI